MKLETLGVLESVAEVVGLLEHVWVDEAQIAQTCARVDTAALKLPAWDEPVFVHSDPAALAGQILLFNCINFCYWGEPKWRIEYAGTEWDGSFGLLMAIQRALAEGLPLLDGAYLAAMPRADFDHVLRGQGRLHLPAERLEMWQLAGTALVKRYGGSFTNVITAAEGDAIALAERLVEDFPFDDRAELAGREVRFFKRAQLAAAMLYEALHGQGLGALSGVERLTVFADYKVPQVLRGLGILAYDRELAARVDARVILPGCERYEVEIRAATIWAAEMMRKALAAREPGITALHLDYWLWHAGQQASGLLPYHRTLSTAY